MNNLETHINLTGLHDLMVFSMQPQCIHNLHLVASVYYQTECVWMHKYKHLFDRPLSQIILKFTLNSTHSCNFHQFFLFLAYYYNIIMLNEIFVVDNAIFKSIAIPFQPPEI